MANSTDEVMSGRVILQQQRETLLKEIDTVASDLAHAKSVVLSEIDAFSRAQKLSTRLSELGKERDALTLQIEQAKS